MHLMLRTVVIYDVAEVKLGAFSRRSSCLYCSMRNSGVMIIGKTYSTLEHSQKREIGLDLTVENIRKCVGSDEVHELMVHPGYVAKQDQGGFDGPDDFALSSDRLYEFNFLMNQTEFEIL